VPIHTRRSGGTQSARIARAIDINPADDATAEPHPLRGSGREAAAAEQVRELRSARVRLAAAVLAAKVAGSAEASNQQEGRQEQQ
jgi:hypothetical protein